LISLDNVLLMEMGGDCIPEATHAALVRRLEQAEAEIRMARLAQQEDAAVLRREVEKCRTLEREKWEGDRAAWAEERKQLLSQIAALRAEPSNGHGTQATRGRRRSRFLFWCCLPQPQRRSKPSNPSDSHVPYAGLPSADSPPMPQNLSNTSTHDSNIAMAQC